MKPPIAVALITNDQNEILVGQRCDAGHMPGELELLGGKVEPGEEPEHTAHREVLEEMGSHVRILGLAVRFTFEDEGGSRGVEVWNAELLSGPDISAKEPTVHGGVGYRSFDELRGKGVHLSRALRKLSNMVARKTLELKISEQGQRTWHKRTTSGIN